MYILKTCIQQLVALLVLAILAIPAGADPQRHLSEEDMARRLAFIEERLNAGRTSARYWQYGWSGFYAANMAAQGYMAFKSNDGDHEAKYAVGAVKSAVALALMLFRPLPATEGAAPLEDMPTGTLAQKEARLKAAEDLLQTNAARAGERRSWSRHLTAIGVHFIGSTTIAAIGDVKDAVVSNVSGIAISQVHIWSQPHRAIDDLAAYERAFPDPPSHEPLAWELTPIQGGLGVTFRF